MLDDATRSQIAALRILPGKPLVLCDVDEVVVHFIRGLEDYLSENNMWLDPASFALNGNIKHQSTNIPISTDELETHLMTFFDQRTRLLEPVEGAKEALLELAADGASIVMVTNVPNRFRQDRISNLASHGIDFPVITNQGPKGPAVAEICANHVGPVTFIDDNPGYLLSVNEHCPRANLIHFMQDERFGRHVAPLDFVSLRAREWCETSAHIRTSWRRPP